jgi:hypothetical protein
VSDASTFRTSDWDNPNCSAIKDGLMPALNAARTALTCPRINETAASLAVCRSLVTTAPVKSPRPERLGVIYLAASPLRGMS